jgi:hypothetical protein
MSRYCRATKNVHAPAGHKTSHTLSRYRFHPFQTQENTPQETPGPTLCNGKSKWYHHRHHRTPCHTPSAGFILRSDLLGRVQGTAQITCHHHQVSTTNHPRSARTRGKKTHLSFTISPKIHPAPNNIIKCRIRRLIKQHSAQSRQRQPQQPCHHAAVQVRARDPSQRPFVGEADERDDDVEDLQDGDGFDGRVEVFGQEVEEEFGPEEGFEGAG